MVIPIILPFCVIQQNTQQRRNLCACLLFRQSGELKYFAIEIFIFYDEVHISVIKTSTDRSNLN